MKWLFTLILTFSFCTSLFAQSFHLKFEEVSRSSSSFEVDVYIASSTNALRLGSSNLQFSFHATDIQSPSLVSNNLNTSAYNDVSLKEPQEGETSLNISLASPGTGDTLAQYPNWTNLARLRFDVVNSAGDFSLEWLYNGGSTHTVVYESDEGTQLFANQPEEDLINFNGMILPVELLAFQADWQDAQAQKNASIQWITAREQNSDFFRLQRSFDGQTWENIAKVQAAGTSTNQELYEVADPNIGQQMSAAYVYYRLKQVDIDGSIGYSDVQALERSEAAQTVLQISPNPAKDRISLQYTAQTTGPIRLRLMGLDGQVYREALRQPSEASPVQIEIATLPAGVYFLHLQDGQKGLSRKFIKQ